MNPPSLNANLVIHIHFQDIYTVFQSYLHIHFQYRYILRLCKLLLHRQNHELSLRTILPQHTTPHSSVDLYCDRNVLHLPEGRLKWNQVSRKCNTDNKMIIYKTKGSYYLIMLLVTTFLIPYVYVSIVCSTLGIDLKPWQCYNPVCTCTNVPGQYKLYLKKCQEVHYCQHLLGV